MASGLTFADEAEKAVTHGLRPRFEDAGACYQHVNGWVNETLGNETCHTDVAERVAGKNRRYGQR